MPSSMPCGRVLLWGACACLAALASGCGTSGPGERSDDAAATAPRSAEDSATPARELRVAAASDLRFALDDVVREFQGNVPGARIGVTYGSSGSFFAQLSNRAPYDVFLSADLEYPRRLIEEQDFPAGADFVYAIGRIVIWVRNDSPLDFESQGLAALADSSVRKIALANPRYAPYGRAGLEALKSTGVYDDVRERLVYAETVAQAAQYAESSSADAGIIGRSLAHSPALREAGRSWDVPLEAYPTMEQAGLVLPWAEDPELAGQFREFLLGPQGRAILERHGFSLPELAARTGAATKW